MIYYVQQIPEGGGQMLLAAGAIAQDHSPSLMTFSLASRRLEPLKHWRDVKSVLYMAVNRARTRLFVCGAGQQGQGAAACYAMQGDALALQDIQPTQGGECCHLALNSDETMLFCANYNEGSMSIHPIQNGRLMPTQHLITHQGHSLNKERQEGPHIHQCILRPQHDQLFVADLGLDQVVIYALGKLPKQTKRLAHIAIAPGWGPRHLVFDGPDRFYLACELSNTVLFYQFIHDRWQQMQSISTLASVRPDNTVAAIRLYGRSLRVSNRGEDTIVRFALDQSGRMRGRGRIPAHGQVPRDFMLAQRQLLIANQQSGRLCLVDNSGQLQDDLAMPGVVCVHAC